MLSLPSILLSYIGLRRPTGSDDPPGSSTFYEGHVLHVRRAPVRNEFRYAVRMAVVDLERPPAWFARAQAADHMTADQARSFAGTTGPVKLLTDPISAGYVQNPISVYYCYSGSSGSSSSGAGEAAAGEAEPKLERCIAEVTNTPWNERVTFVFDPAGAAVAKALHVSPFMDMHNTWHLEAPSPGERLKLVVRASHPVYGDYFHADLVARRCVGSSSSSSGSGSSSRGAGAAGVLNEEAGLGRLWAYGFMPHRVALLIYWQAVKLLVKGVPFYAPPSKTYQRLLLAEGAAAGAGAAGDKGKAGANGAAANGSSSSGNNGTAAAAEPDMVSACGGAPGGLCPVAAWSRGAVGHSHPRNAADGKHFVWRPAPGWPWRD